MVDEQELQRNLQSPTMQGLVELLATADLVRKMTGYRKEVERQRRANTLVIGDAGDGEDDGESKEKEEKLEEDVDGGDNNNKHRNNKNHQSKGRVEFAEFYVKKVHVVRAVFGWWDGSTPPRSLPKTARDVSTALRAWVRDVFNGTQIVLPFKTATELAERVPAVFAPHPAPARSQAKLYIEYQMVTPQYDAGAGDVVDVVAKTLDKTIVMPNKVTKHHKAASPVVIRPATSWFDRVVEISRFTLDMQEDGKLPCDFVVEAYRLSQLANSFYAVLRDVHAVKRAHSTLAVVPDSGYDASQLNAAGAGAADSHSMMSRRRKSASSSSSAAGGMQFTVSLWVHLPPDASGSGAGGQSRRPQAASRRPRSKSARTSDEAKTSEDKRRRTPASVTMAPRRPSELAASPHPQSPPPPADLELDNGLIHAVREAFAADLNEDAGDREQLLQSLEQMAGAPAGGSAAFSRIVQVLRSDFGGDDDDAEDDAPVVMEQVLPMHREVSRHLAARMFYDEEEEEEEVEVDEDAIFIPDDEDEDEEEDVDAQGPRMPIMRIRDMLRGSVSLQQRQQQQQQQQQQPPPRRHVRRTWSQQKVGRAGHASARSQPTASPAAVAAAAVVTSVVDIVFNDLTVTVILTAAGPVDVGERRPPPRPQPHASQCFQRPADRHAARRL
eukprot:TRINITY_DN67388_c7_g2_i2.p1 TRINITY_DN67388_c7_g2~~TRINITY_DN67388_c7_g2_i2.p1  ORF type:complete len:699 (+),score=378.64 TRINITY_DN67388_c7_g2_i2:98-2098(+)